MFLPLVTMRSCSRCGKEFKSLVRRIVCDDCKSNPEIKKHILSYRENQVCSLIIKRNSYSNHQIADELHLSEGTIKAYLHRIFRKLGVKSRTELAIKVMREHIVNIPSVSGTYQV